MVEKVEFAPTFTVSGVIFISDEAYSITIWLYLMPSSTDTSADAEFYVWPGLCRSQLATRVRRLLKLASRKTIRYEF